MGLYDNSKIMELLGNQCVLETLENDEVRKAFEEVLEAHEKHTLPCHSIIFEIGLDFFSLGYIMGKRAERSKKKGKWLV